MFWEVFYYLLHEKTNRRENLGPIEFAMSKRGPASKLDHDNWDDEEEGEEAGHFVTAKKEVLQKREIRKAKRKGLGDNTDENGESKGSAFKGFTGFSFNTGSSAASFNFKPTSNGSNTAETTSTTTTLTTTKPMFGSGSTTSQTSSASEQSSKYLHSLKNLNQSVNKWIADHVDKNPYCILTPIFKDYEKHLEDLEKKYPDHSKGKQPDDVKKPEAAKSETVTSPPSTFTFGAASKPTGSGSDTVSSLKPADKPNFTFGGSAGAGGTSTGIFGAAGTSDGKSGFSFAVNKPAESADQEKEEEYVPPVLEVETVKEDDAFYTKRCKIYYKKGDSWADRGVGNLHLKKVNEKNVLLIRANTNLGNILLNIMLTSSIPVNRQGKNNVMIMCVPNPPLDEKNKDDQTPVSMLLRVKTAEDADELCEKMKECQADK